jgi:Tfp pilus assembly protein PilX
MGRPALDAFGPSTATEPPQGSAAGQAREGLKESTMRTTRAPGRRTRGIALPTALLVLVILTLLGTAAVFTSGTDVDIAGNGRSELAALSLAEGGVHEAIARLNMESGATRIVPQMDAATPPAPVAAWQRKVVNKSTLAANEVQTVTGAFGQTSALDVETTVAYKRESTNEQPPRCNADGCADADVVLFRSDFGYGGTLVPPVTANAPAVLQITAVTTAGGGARKSITVDVTRDMTRLRAPGAVRACGNVNCEGNSMRVDGTQHPDGTAIQAGGAIGGSPGGCSDTKVDPDPSGSDSVQSGGTYTCPPDPFAAIFGMTRNEMRALAAAQTPSGVCAAPCPIPPTNGSTKGRIIYITGLTPTLWNGVGTIGTPAEPMIIVSEGNLTLEGNLTVNGIVYTMGAVATGSGTMNVNGAVIAQNNATLSGNGTTTYDPRVFAALTKWYPYVTIQWAAN